VRGHLVGGAILLVIVAAGCSSAVPGAPAPDRSDRATTASASPPARQGDGIDMGRFDPCTALTAEQAATLGLDDPKPGSPSQGEKTCIWSHYLSEPIESYLIDGSAKVGIDSLAAIGGPFSIGGRKAIISRSEYGNLENSCAIVVEISPGQSLHINYGYEGSTQPMTHDLACQKAKPVAEMVVANLDRGGN
jgi:hypothetical protein